MSRNAWPWSALDLDGPADPREVRRAYARKLKAIDQAADPAGFQTLRQAFELAKAMAGEGDRPRVQVVFTPEPAEPEPPQPIETAPIPDLPAPEADETTANEAPEPVDELIIDLSALEAELEADATPAEPPVPIPRFEDDPTFNEAAAFAEIEALLQGPTTTPEMIDQALSDPHFGHPGRFARLEHRVFRALSGDMRSSGQGHRVLAPQIKPDVIAVLDRHFRWLSDYKSLRSKFGQQADEIALAMQLRRDFGVRTTSQSRQMHWLAAGAFIFVAYFVLRVVVEGLLP